MTLTKTHDVEATIAQIAALASAGCEIVRVAVPKLEDAEALPRIVRLSPLPVIADIHFNASLALKAIEGGVAAVRINPGNIGGPDKVALAGDAVLGLDQERCGHGRAARRRDRRHDAGLAHCGSRRGDQDRLRDPQVARLARARADHDRLPELRP